MVDGLQNEEQNRVSEFYRKTGTSPPRSQENDGELPGEKNFLLMKNEKKTDSSEDCIKPSKEFDYHRMDEQISIHLISWHQTASSADEIDKNNIIQRTADGNVFRPYLRLSCFATVNHLRKYLAYRLYGTLDRYAEVIFPHFLMINLNLFICSLNYFVKGDPCSKNIRSSSFPPLFGVKYLIKVKSKMWTW